MAYCVNIAGVDVTKILTGTTAGDDTPEFVLGTKAEMSDGGIYRYVYYTAVKTAGLMYLLDGATWLVGAALTTTNADAADPTRVCVFATTQTAPADTNGYGWACTLPVGIGISLLTACAEDVPLYTTATGGSLDDTATTSVVGIVNSSGGAASGTEVLACTGTVEMYATIE